MHLPQKVTRIISINTSHGSKVLESFHCSPFSDVATVVLLAHQLATRRHLFTDESLQHRRVVKVNAGRRQSDRAGCSAA